jgi:hypothetical protein
MMLLGRSGSGTPQDVITGGGSTPPLNCCAKATQYDAMFQIDIAPRLSTSK